MSYVVQDSVRSYLYLNILMSLQSNVCLKNCTWRYEWLKQITYVRIQIHFCLFLREKSGQRPTNICHHPTLYKHVMIPDKKWQSTARTRGIRYKVHLGNIFAKYISRTFFTNQSIKNKTSFLGHLNITFRNNTDIALTQWICKQLKSW